MTDQTAQIETADKEAVQRETVDKEAVQRETAPLTGTALVKEVCRLIRLARSRWDAHDNGGCRRERSRALRLYRTLTEEQKDEIPQQLRIWLRYRSERYFGARKKQKKKKKQ